ncbi:MAG: response regulator [Sediminicola sp.]|tara:strand:+ start:32719 stop:33162 length:444 start_codon:yes stop_codon:yes gene_type:complete
MGPKRIIIWVEDDEDDRILFKEAVEDLKIPVQLKLFGLGKDLLAYIDTTEDPLPELLFLDLNMPEISGLEVLKKLKEHPKWSKIPVAICSTSSRESDMQKTFLMGANIYFTKPNSFRVLQAAIKRILVTNYQHHTSNLQWENFILNL